MRTGFLPIAAAVLLVGVSCSSEDGPDASPSGGGAGAYRGMDEQPWRTECLVCCLPMRLSYQLPALAGHAGWEALKCDVCGAIRIFEVMVGDFRREVHTPNDPVPPEGEK